MYCTELQNQGNTSGYVSDLEFGQGLPNAEHFIES